MYSVPQKTSDFVVAIAWTQLLGTLSDLKFAVRISILTAIVREIEIFLIVAVTFLVVTAIAIACKRLL